MSADNPKQKRIVLITTGQPATNPRLVKEADALSSTGYDVTVLYSFWTDWAQKQDQEILKSATWKAIQLGGTPTTDRLTYHLTRFRKKVAGWFPAWPQANYRVLCRTYDELLDAAIHYKADLYIAHNLGALPVAAEAARRTGGRYAFDAEDFHRGEDNNPDKAALVKRVEDRYIPGAAYCTAASPLIAETYQHLYPEQTFTTILNVFPLNYQPPFRPGKPSEPLRLFWFSQTVGLDRGIQDVLEAIREMPDEPVKVTLLGLCTDKSRAHFRSFLNSDLHTIHFMDTVTETELFRIAAEQDIGLALERSAPLNRDICLTNKIFVSLMAGNAILASSTRGQSEFMAAYSGTGWVYPAGDTQALAARLRALLNDRTQLESCRSKAWQMANTRLHWEQEKVGFLKLTERALASA